MSELDTPDINEGEMVYFVSDTPRRGLFRQTDRKYVATADVARIDTTLGGTVHLELQPHDDLYRYGSRIAGLTPRGVFTGAQVNRLIAERGDDAFSLCAGLDVAAKTGASFNGALVTLLETAFIDRIRTGEM